MNILKTGIDISTWQGAFDLSEAKSEGFDFVIIKGGGGDAGLYTDKRFAENYEKAKVLGMPVGVYWFSKALTVDDAVKEAEYFYENCLKSKQFELPVYIDVENKTQLAVGKRLLTDIIHAWCQNLEDKGFWVGIYSSQSFFSSYMYDEELQRYAHWIACWAKTCNYAKDCFGMWQYGGETNLIRSNKVAGVTCDQDYMLIDYPTLIKSAKKNGYDTSKTQVVAPVQPVTPAVPTMPAAPAKTNLVAGAKLTLNAVTLYASSTSTTKAGTKTGTYYLWSDAVVNNRVRITNSTANVGNASQVTGWISVSDAEAASVTSTNSSSASTSTPATTELTAGTKLTLKSVALYAASTSTTKAGTKTGTYYVWGTQVVNNRIRITNSTANVGKSNQVTGWIALSDAKAAAGI